MPFSCAAARATRHLQRVLGRTPHAQRALVQAFTQGLPLQKLRYEVMHRTFRAHVVDSQKVWVVERAQNARLMLESLQMFDISREGLWQNLSRYRAH